MSDFILMIAMKAELPDLFPRPFGTWCMGGSTVRVVKTGMGKNKAGAAMQKILGQSEPGNSCNSGNSCKSVNPAFIPDFILALGFCGGTRDDLAIGDLIVADRVRYRDRVIDLPTSLTLTGFVERWPKKWPVMNLKSDPNSKPGLNLKPGQNLKPDRNLKPDMPSKEEPFRPLTFPFFPGAVFRKMRSRWIWKPLLWRKLRRSMGFP